MVWGYAFIVSWGINLSSPFDADDKSGRRREKRRRLVDISPRGVIMISWSAGRFNGQ